MFLVTQPSLQLCNWLSITHTRLRQAQADWTAKRIRECFWNSLQALRLLKSILDERITTGHKKARPNWPGFENELTRSVLV